MRSVQEDPGAAVAVLAFLALVVRRWILPVLIAVVVALFVVGLLVVIAA